MLNALTSLIVGAIGVSGPPPYIVTFSDGSSRQVTANELLAAQAAIDAAESVRIAAEADKAELREQFATAAARLQQITDDASPTNAQVIAAVRGMAAIQRKMLRALYSLMT